MGKIGVVSTYICPTCGNAQQQVFDGAQVRCNSKECSSELFEAMVSVIQRWDAQIRKTLKMSAVEDIDLDDLKKFCSLIFDTEIWVYQDYRTILATLTILKTIDLEKINYKF
ncbi:hypothetical protein SS50377_25043 [Spironucleus salmonicida]|uniref:Uncharacterized protein n=1 Tax=Spironucleus salmonicida TaxID=348837 RepID=V6LH99_9EUKA|nr:hypothetical protein SS50377_25043 [Spironucleus salmonicida]|eukprot:EST43096.1 Hypothetical protein SS50377_17253 [Spironucleus salmonicida]